MATTGVVRTKPVIHEGITSRKDRPEAARNMVDCGTEQGVLLEQQRGQISQDSNSDHL